MPAPRERQMSYRLRKALEDGQWKSVEELVPMILDVLTPEYVLRHRPMRQQFKRPSGLTMEQKVKVGRVSKTREYLSYLVYDGIVEHRGECLKKEYRLLPNPLPRINKYGIRRRRARLL